MTAMRLARGVTGRDLVVKFAGCYHGHMTRCWPRPGRASRRSRCRVRRASPRRPPPRPWCCPTTTSRPSRPRSRARLEIAAVITEAVTREHGRGAAGEGFNEGLRRITATHGALLILDEVLTGFRVGPAGCVGRSRTASGRRGPATRRTCSRSARSSAAACRWPRSAGRRRSWTTSRPSAPSTRRAPCRGTRSRSPRASTTLRLADDAVYARVDATPPRCRTRVRRGPGRRGRGAPRAAGRQPVLGVLRPDCAAARACATTRRPRLRRRAATRRSSTRCWTPGSTCRRRSSRPGSSPPRTTTPRCRASSIALPAAARAAATASAA